MKKPTVTIGIPAYNEEKNIKNLVLSLLKQDSKSFLLKQIVVVLDGSTDNTKLNLERVTDKKIVTIIHRRRLGKNRCLNEIFQKSDTNILILMDADVLPKGNKFLENIVNVFSKNPKTSLVCIKTEPFKARNWFEKIINTSHRLKIRLNSFVANLKPVYVCNGRTLGLTRSLYKKLKLQTNRSF